MTDSKQKNLPELFGWLVERGYFGKTAVHTTSDGFCAATVSIADMLARRDITVVPGRQGDLLDCRLFFDDWYLYAVSDGAAVCCKYDGQCAVGTGGPSFGHVNDRKRSAQ